VFDQLAAQGVAVDAEHLGGDGLVAVGLRITTSSIGRSMLRRTMS
jgi:hypothetical protein